MVAEQQTKAPMVIICLAEDSGIDDTPTSDDRSIQSQLQSRGSQPTLNKVTVSNFVS